MLICEFLQIDLPCIPCINDCSLYNCNASCSAEDTVLKVFSLDNLNLTAMRNNSGTDELATYYLTGMLMFKFISNLTYLRYRYFLGRHMYLSILNISTIIGLIFYLEHFISCSEGHKWIWCLHSVFVRWLQCRHFSTRV
jgi:hypothetical protein